MMKKIHPFDFRPVDTRQGSKQQKNNSKLLDSSSNEEFESRLDAPRELELEIIILWFLTSLSWYLRRELKYYIRPRARPFNGDLRAEVPRILSLRPAWNLPTTQHTDTRSSSGPSPSISIFLPSPLSWINYLSPYLLRQFLDLFPPKIQKKSVEKEAREKRECLHTERGSGSLAWTRHRRQ